MNKKVSMSDIAKELGVSKTTVSRAFKDSSEISEQQKERILDKAKEMNYTFNSAAQTLRTSVTKNFGIIVNNHFNEQGESFYNEIFHQIVIELEKYNYSAILETYSADKIPLFLKENKIDGIIILGETNKKYLKSMQEITKNVVVIDDSTAVFDSIVTDNFTSSYKATEYLIKKGHKSIGFIGNKELSKSIMERFYGYSMALEQYKIENAQNFYIHDRNSEGEFIELEFGQEIASAYFCNNDKTAFELVRALDKKNIKVPEDVSVIGFDDTVYAQISDPKLTTCHVQIKLFATEGIRLLLDRIETPEKDISRISISAPLIKRNSVFKVK